MRTLLFALLFSSLLCASLPAQTDAPPSLAARLDAVLAQVSSGHSPTPDEISAVETLDPAPDAAAVRQALPALEKALASPDNAVRTYTLTLLVGLQVPPPAPESGKGTPETTAAPAANTAASGPVAYKPPVAQALTPAIPAIAARLKDDEPSIRLLAAAALGGFTPDPPPALYPPLLAYLKRDDGIGPTGAAVVGDLLQVGPVSAETAAAVIAYLGRGDQSAAARSTLVDTIASKPYQSVAINRALLLYLNSDDNSLRARIILSLPQFDLDADTFTEMKDRIATLAAIDPAGGQENLQVINAARAVSPCWTKVRMTSGCPVY